MIIGDAFGYRPPEPVDWLLCDVICRPERTLELAETWMREGLCRRLVATLKFTGTGDYAAHRRARARLGAAGVEVRAAQAPGEPPQRGGHPGPAGLTGPGSRRWSALVQLAEAIRQRHHERAEHAAQARRPPPWPRRVTTRTTVSVVASTLAVRAPGDSTAVSPNTAPGPISRSSRRWPCTVLKAVQTPSSITNAASPSSPSVTMRAPAANRRAGNARPPRRNRSTSAFSPSGIVVALLRIGRQRPAQHRPDARRAAAARRRPCAAAPPRPAWPGRRSRPASGAAWGARPVMIACSTAPSP